MGYSNRLIGYNTRSKRINLREIATYLTHEWIDEVSENVSNHVIRNISERSEDSNGVAIQTNRVKSSANEVREFDYYLVR